MKYHWISSFYTKWQDRSLGPSCLVTELPPTAVPICTEPFMCLLTTQYLSRSHLISSKTKGWQRNTRQPFLTFLGGLRKSSAVLNLILSVQLTARGDSVRGFISTANLSLKAKIKRREEKVFVSCRSLEEIPFILSGRNKTPILV